MCINVRSLCCDSSETDTVLYVHCILGKEKRRDRVEDEGEGSVGFGVNQHFKSQQSIPLPV